MFSSLRNENDRDITKTSTLLFLANLTEKLQEKGIITEEELDDMLLDATC